MWARLREQCAPLLDPAQTHALLAAAGIAADSVTPLWRRLSARPPQRFAFQLRRGELAAPAAVIVLPPARAAEVLDKWSHLHPEETPFGAGVRPLALPGAILFLWPNDRELRQARLIHDLDKLKRLLPDAAGAIPPGWRVRARHSQLRWVRLKPETRAVAQLDLGLKNDASGATAQHALYLRLFQDERGARLDALLRHLREAVPDLRIPRPCGTLFEGRCQLETAVTGKPLDPLRALQHIDTMVELMRTLHSAPPLPGAAPQDRNTDIDDLSLLAPELSQLVAEVRAALHTTSAPRTPAMVHGDLYLWQFLADDHGLGLIDFERAGSGFAEDDYGLMLAHATLAAEELKEPGAHEFREALLRKLGRGAGWYRHAEASALTALALGPLRRGLADGMHRAESRLRTALRRLHAFSKPARADNVAELRLGGLLCEKAHPRPHGKWPGRFHSADGSECFGLFDPGSGHVEILQADADPLAVTKPTETLVAWRPGSRAVLRRAGGDVVHYVKRYAGTKARLARQRHLLMSTLAAAQQGFPDIAPLLEGADNEVVTAALEGAALHDALWHSDAAEALERTGTALRVFHTVPAPDLPRTQPPTQEFLLRVLHTSAPQLLSTAEAAAAQLLAPSECAAWLCHADLHDRNVLVRNTNIALIDLDMVQPGDPSEDIGNLAAHCVLRALQHGDAATHGFRAAQGLTSAWGCSSAEAPACAAAAARTFFRLAVLYSLRRRWQHLSPTLLALTAEAGAIHP